jgi:5-bromo-4-chloroindolyl phosphate hydrolysis protein
MKTEDMVWVFIAILILIFFPIFFIWSLNTLFGIGIAYNFWTWLASFFLISLLGGGKLKSK